MIQQFDFGQWLPDQPDLNNPGLIDCINVFPTGSAYNPINGPVATGSSISGEARGGTRIIRPDMSQIIAIGTVSNLYTIGGSVVSSGLSLAINGFWTFVPFGRQVWAFAPGVKPHYLADIATGTTFAPHPGIAPQAATAARVGDFIVAGNLVDIETSIDPYRIRWSRFNDPAGDWGDDIALQSGAVNMPVQSGPVVAIAGGDFGIILQRFGVSRLEYAGGTAVFSKVEISAGRGCAAPQSVVQVAGVTYFLSDDGFFRTDGASVQPISSQRVFDWFSSRAKGDAIDKVQGAIDWRSRCIIWSFDGVNNASGYSHQIIYNWEADRWSSAVISVDWLLDTIKSGLTLEQVSAIYPDLDAMTISLDSPTFQARGRSLTAIKGGVISNMTGPSLTATIETGEFQPAPGYRTHVNGVAVLVENTDGNSLVALGARDRVKGDTVRWTNDHPEGGDGMAHPNIDGRYVRARVTIPEGAQWAKASGIQAEFVKTGRA